MKSAGNTELCNDWTSEDAKIKTSEGFWRKILHNLGMI